MATELFQRLMMKYYGESIGVQIYFEDLLFCADTSKFQYYLNKIKLLGLIFNEYSVTSDQNKTRVIQELNEPVNKKELQSLLGMINYLRFFF